MSMSTPLGIGWGGPFFTGENTLICSDIDGWLFGGGGKGSKNTVTAKYNGPPTTTWFPASECHQL